MNCKHVFYSAVIAITFLRGRNLREAVHLFDRTVLLTVSQGLVCCQQCSRSALWRTNYAIVTPILCFPFTSIYLSAAKNIETDLSAISFNQPIKSAYRCIDQLLLFLVHSVSNVNHGDSPELTGRRAFTTFVTVLKQSLTLSLLIFPFAVKWCLLLTGGVLQLHK